MNDTLEMLVMNRVENFDLIIDRSPLSLDVKIYRYYRFDDNSNKGDDFDLFGYKDSVLNDVINSKAIIDFNPSRAFLNYVGLFSEGLTPILAYFKSSDNVKRQDVVEILYKDSRVNRNDVYKNRFVVVDILTISFIGTYIYRLAPER